jgi:glycosyltransferase involved in cell wall biosynthesis
MNDLAIIIPCRNESKNIIKILKKLNNKNIFIINDSSSDNLKKKIKHFKNIKILNNLKRQGYEKSIIKGISFIKKLS